MKPARQPLAINSCTKFHENPTNRFVAEAKSQIDGRAWFRLVFIFSFVKRAKRHKHKTKDTQENRDMTMITS
jgi:hypothetical protein